MCLILPSAFKSYPVLATPALFLRSKSPSLRKPNRKPAFRFVPWVSAAVVVDPERTVTASAKIVAGRQLSPAVQPGSRGSPGRQAKFSFKLRSALVIVDAVLPIALVERV